MYINKSFVFNIAIYKIVFALLCVTMTSFAFAAEKHAGFAMRGEPKYPDNFAHYESVNPNAPQGGELRLSATGSFDTFNPFLIKGEPAAGLGLIYETLMVRSPEEPFTRYPLIAEYIEVPDARDWVRFYINPKAKFSDGSKITAEDVRYSFELLTTKGQPFFRQYYADVKEVKVDSELVITFTFFDSNEEMPLILAELQVLSKKYWQDKDFSKSNLDVPVGSGPYTIKEFKVGSFVNYEKTANYWGADLPVNVGKFNFKTISYKYYKDQTVALEAFKAGEYDYREEHISKVWATGYAFPAVKEGKVIVENIPHTRPTGMQAFIFNLRKEKFADPLVREALGYLFDFEWSNKTLFYGQYKRTLSYFSNSDMASSGLPSEDEIALLEPYRDIIPPEVFTKEFTLPITKGDGNIRPQLRQALALLKKAGFTLENNQLRDKNGKQLAFEITLVSAGFKRVVNPFIQNLKKLGIDATVKLVDMSQYIKKMQTFDFDMVILSIGQSESPGNEQISFWHSSTANQEGSRNYMGIQNPAIDGLIDKIIRAKSLHELQTATRAMDRVLLWGHYLIPHWHISADRVAYWNTIQRPDLHPHVSVDTLTWWSNAQR